MAKRKKTLDLIMIIDRSGSMSFMDKEASASINKLIRDQKSNKNTNINFTLTQFDDTVETVVDNEKIENVFATDDYVLLPRGMTALYDAIGKTVSNYSPKKKADKVLCVIVTDGHENASHEYSSNTIKKIIEEKEKAGWVFSYLGANQDAFLVAKSMGIGVHSGVSGTTRGYTVETCCDSYQAISDAIVDVTCSMANDEEIKSIFN